MTEAQTRQSLINQGLAKAGWTSKQHKMVEEYGIVSSGNNEFADYVLLDSDANPLALVEAKRTSRDAIAGQRQASDYADSLENQTGIDPFIFLSNGLESWFWERGMYPPRTVSNFFSPEDLVKLRHIRRYRKSLEAIEVSTKIVNRDYQLEAVKRVTEGLAAKHRKFLLVMATGTGKTRTALAIVDLLLRAQWIQRILFLVDRRALAKQASDAVKEYLPRQTPFRIEGGHVDEDAHIHIATYPSAMQVYKQLSPAYYDLVIADESHRSIYNKYKDLFDYFDAYQLGLTATPTDFLDHNTYELFECADGLPTFNYTYELAVEENHLADYKVLQAQTAFQVEGIKAGELPQSVQTQLEQQGLELAEIDFEGSDLEKRVTNTGTNDALIREFMNESRKDATGTLPAKTIFFCMSHAHAKELWMSFNRLYPDLQRRGFAEIIDSHMERAESTLDDFKTKDMPRVAISVDMLDTGIDIKPLQNLVFAKPVYSKVKFWQMIGRGTRLWTDERTGFKKKDFLIIDHWNNFSYFNMNPDAETTGSSVPLPTRLFRARLDKFLKLRDMGSRESLEETAQQLIILLADLPKENVNVRPHLLDQQPLSPEKEGHPRRHPSARVGRHAPKSHRLGGHRREHSKNHVRGVRQRPHDGPHRLDEHDLARFRKPKFRAS